MKSGLSQNKSFHMSGEVKQTLEKDSGKLSCPFWKVYFYEPNLLKWRGIEENHIHSSLLLKLNVIFDCSLMGVRLLQSISDYLDSGIDECVNQLYDSTYMETADELVLTERRNSRSIEIRCIKRPLIWYRRKYAVEYVSVMVSICLYIWLISL